MKNLFSAAAILALVATGSVATAGIGNGKGVDNGNKNGWTSRGPTDTPRGLVESGENGRTDKGRGNGGENALGAPSAGGEFSPSDDAVDPGK